MPSVFMKKERLLIAAASLLFAFHLALAQSPTPALSAVTSFSLYAKKGLHISRETDPQRPFSVVGPHGAVLGQENGSFEVWHFPWKILSNMRITARMQGDPIPIDVNAHASWINVRPYATTITFSYASFTVREIIFAPKQASAGAGVMVLYQVEAVRPMTLIFSFNPVMQRMWPVESADRPVPEWVPTGNNSGFYLLRLKSSDHAAVLAMPTAEEVTLHPPRERVQNDPLQFVLHFDPAHDSSLIYPLLLAFGDTQATATREALEQQLAVLNTSVKSIYQGNERYYQNLLATRMSIATPNKKLDAAFSWAEVSMDQLRVLTTPEHKEEALTAGFFGSGDAARPGFGWFFGRDALWSLYAINSEGDYKTTREEIAFLLKRQSPAGKILHEWSQTADLVAWKELPYEFASADATELLPMAVNDYLRISGDLGFVQRHWESLQRAWNFECTHDTDGDGIYDNSEGSGWVESWIPSMPHQEIYVAVLDEQASLAFADLARATGHKALAASALIRATRIRKQIEKEYFLPQTHFYAFSWNGNGITDNTDTIFPAVAWWDGDYALAHYQVMMSRMASSEFSTDWGTRILSDQTSFYDPISYHQGTVWPLFTGWVSVAEYRTGHTLSGYAHLMENANLTYTQDSGNITELLSGEFFQPLARSTAHQLWSSAMVVSPVVRGLFGLEWDAAAKSLSVSPHLPANWNEATLTHIPFADNYVDLRMTRHGTELLVQATHAPAGVRLTSKIVGSRVERRTTLRIPLPPVEVSISQNLPEFGETTSQLKVLDEQYAAHQLKLTLAAPGGTLQTIQVRENAANLKVLCENGEMESSTNGLRTVMISFPPAKKYVMRTVILRW
ncbi:MAG: amylo-alpha-1,6-glucosidase [Acidobacteriaceae bacterium]